MAWTAPRTWVDGEVPNAALLNTHVRDNLETVSPTSLSATYAPVFTPEKYGGAADGVTNSTTAIQSAIDAAAAARPFTTSGATVALQAGGYLTNAPLVMKSGVCLRGAGRQASTIRNTTTTMFAWSVDSLSHINIRDLTLKTTAAAGHIFDLSGNGGVYMSEIADCNLEASGANASIFKHRGTGVYIEVDVTRCNLTRSAVATVPGWDVVQADSLTNSNTWRRIRIHSNTASSTPFFRFECTSTSTRNYDFTFEDITGEQNGGGLIHTFGAIGVRISSVNDYDQPGAYSGDLFKFGITTGLLTSDVVIIASGRRGGTLGSGVKDINCGSNTDSSKVTIVSCAPASGNLTATLNDGCVLINTNTTLYPEKHFYMDPVRVSAFGGTAAFTVQQRFASAHGLDIYYDAAAGAAYRSLRIGRYIDTNARFEISQDGTMYLGDGTAVATPGIRLGDGVLPGAASASYQGEVRFIRGGAGVADRAQICRKDAAGAFAWVDLF